MSPWPESGGVAHDKPGANAIGDLDSNDEPTFTHGGLTMIAPAPTHPMEGGIAVVW
jgi:hypothetical protein